MHLILEEDHRFREVNEDLEKRLRAFNEAAAGPLHRQPIAFTVRGDGDALIGGLTGELFWNALYIVSLWVDDQHRRRGYGAALLRAAEDTARARACHVSYLSTFGFQAPAFYEKHGYEAFGELTGVPPGSSRTWFRKRLASTADGDARVL